MSNNPTYSIVRFHAHAENEEGRRTGLTLEEAQEHCGDSETSSSTCSDEMNEAVPGVWFDGYREE
jgi:hypothetical protein